MMPSQIQLDQPCLRPLPEDAVARVIAILRPVCLDKTMELLAACRPAEVLIEEVRGYGRQKTHLEFYEQGSWAAGFVPKIRLEFIVNGERAQEAVEAIVQAACTGRIGDGKIFVLVGRRAA